MICPRCQHNTDTLFLTDRGNMCRVCRDKLRGPEEVIAAINSLDLSLRVQAYEQLIRNLFAIEEQELAIFGADIETTVQQLVQGWKSRKEKL